MEDIDRDDETHYQWNADETLTLSFVMPAFTEREEKEARLDRIPLKELKIRRFENVFLGSTLYYPDLDSDDRKGLVFSCWLEEMSEGCQLGVKANVMVYDDAGEELIPLFDGPHHMVFNDSEDQVVEFESKHRKHELERHLTNGTLVVRVEVDFVFYTEPAGKGVAWHSISSRVECGQNFFHEISYPQNPDDTDFTLVSSDGKSYPVHRFVLKSRSPVFAAMLARDYKEKSKTRCEIPDIDGKTLEALLKFMYSCDTTAVPGVAEKLLVAAHKYNIKDLPGICGISLEHSLNGENVGKIMVLSDKLAMDRLKKAAIECIDRNFVTFLRSGQLEIIRDYSSALMEDILNYNELQLNRPKRLKTSGSTETVV